MNWNAERTGLSERDLLELERERIPEMLADLERARARLWLRLHAAELPSRTDNASGDLLTSEEVALMLCVSKRWVYDHQGELGRVKLSRRKLRFRRDAVERFLRRRRSSP